MQSISNNLYIYLLETIYNHKTSVVLKVHIVYSAIVTKINVKWQLCIDLNTLWKYVERVTLAKMSYRISRFR